MLKNPIRLLLTAAVIGTAGTGYAVAGAPENTAAPLHTAVTDKQTGETWEYLFDGKTLDGWVRRGGAAEYRVEDGAIVGSTIPGKTVDGKAVTGTPNTFLCTEKEYGNFVLEVDFLVDPSMNSGIQIRSHSLKDYKMRANEPYRVHGYQVEIDPSDRRWSGGIYDEARRKWLFDLEDHKEAGAAFKNGVWNHFRIEANGENIKTWVNGVPAADLDDFMNAQGLIALQVHGSKAPKSMEIRWKNIRIQDLDRTLPTAKTYAEQRKDGRQLP